MVGLEAVLSLSPTVSMSPVGEELTAFDSASGTAVSLNRTATQIAVLSDGHTSIADIVQLMASAYAVDAESVRTPVLEACDVLVRLGVLKVA
jgi:hypothetical protein